MKKLFILLAAVATLAACGTKKTGTVSDKEYYYRTTDISPEVWFVDSVEPAKWIGEWTITSVNDMHIPDSLGAVLAFNDSLQMYSAYVGCNRINGTWVYADSIVLTDGLSTKMYCEGLMELEQALCVALPQVKEAHLFDTGVVALLSAEGNILLTIKK